MSDGNSPVAPGALHVHEIAVGVLDQPFQLVLPEELGLLQFCFSKTE